MEFTLSKDLLIIGYDPIWDAPIEGAFPLLGKDCWYVNEELPEKKSLLEDVLERRQGKYLGGVLGSYKEFCKALQLELSKILPGNSLQRELPQDKLLHEILDRVNQTYETVLELKRKLTSE